MPTVEVELVLINIAQFGDGKTKLAVSALRAQLNGLEEDGGVVVASLTDTAREVHEDGSTPGSIVVLDVVERSADEQIVEANSRISN